MRGRRRIADGLTAAGYPVHVTIDRATTEVLP